ncbi:FeoA family protein [Chitinolyticbacter albus]|uniref:FeoA family protein n=1 Tax=Chitinolyticbacter albus TaxID=2961951 RepID=UPI0021091D66|nr:FeoA family protein [Chitinolyticbacter albus]
MQLSAMKSGERGTVLAFGPGYKAYRQRLLAMGVMPGTGFTVVRVAPLGDPYEITVRGYTLSLRKHEAAMLLVEAVS